MSTPYENGGTSRRRRGALTHWVPLVLTLTIATAGVAAWAWSQRTRDDEYEEEEDEHYNANSGPGGPQPQRPYTNLDYDHGDYGENPPYGASGADGARGGNEGMHSAETAAGAPGSWGARVTDALSRASSPQQWVGNASKAVTAGFTAASAAVGGALASIRESDRDAYADHETWSEEVDARRDQPTAATAGAAAAAAGGSAVGVPASLAGSSGSRKRRRVAIVVSADSYVEASDDEFHEHASILSHIPRHTDFSKTRVFVLIYAPGLKDNTQAAPDALEAPVLPQKASSLSSSFSNIGADGASASANATVNANANASGSSPQTMAADGSAANAYYTALHAQARALVEKDTQVIPFTMPNGHAHILHILEPDVVYLQESLTGENGSLVTQLQNWMRHDIVVVVGAESGSGGLADSESEAEKPAAGGAGAVPAAQKWWQREDRVGRGRGVVVVDGMRVNDDWLRRVQGHD